MVLCLKKDNSPSIINVIQQGCGSMNWSHNASVQIHFEFMNIPLGEVLDCLTGPAP